MRLGHTLLRLARVWPLDRPLLTKFSKKRHQMARGQDGAKREDRKRVADDPETPHLGRWEYEWANPLAGKD